MLRACRLQISLRVYSEYHCMSAKVGPHEAVCSSQAASRLRQFAIEDLEIRDRKSRGKHTKKIGGSKLTITLTDTQPL